MRTYVNMQFITSTLKEFYSKDGRATAITFQFNGTSFNTFCVQ